MDGNGFASLTVAIVPLLRAVNGVEGVLLNLVARINIGCVCCLSVL